MGAKPITNTIATTEKSSIPNKVATKASSATQSTESKGNPNAHHPE